MGDWPSNHDLQSAGERLRSKFEELFHSPFWFLPQPDLSFVTMPGLGTCLALDPEEIDADFQNIQRLSNRLGTSEEVSRLFAIMDATIEDGWNGEAARAFVGRVAAIEHSIANQRTHLVSNLQYRSAVFRLAVDARYNHLELAETTISAIDIALGNETARLAKGAIATTADLAKTSSPSTPRTCWAA